MHISYTSSCKCQLVLTVHNYLTQSAEPFGKLMHHQELNVSVFISHNALTLFHFLNASVTNNKIRSNLDLLHLTKK